MDEIAITDYDPSWPHMFEQEEAVIRCALPDGLIIRFEHFGSTAIPGLAAKPIIDILLGVNSINDARAVAVPALESLDYAFWSDNPDKEHLFFVKGLPPNGPRTHHVHVVGMASAKWNAILFRDYLRGHFEEADRYLALKRELMERFRSDREAYTEGKSHFVQEIILKAKSDLDN